MDNEKKIVEQQEEIKNLLAAVPGGVFKYEAKPKGKFTFVSSQLLRLLGYTEEEFKKKFNNCFDDMVYEKDRAKVLKSIDDQIQNGEFDTCEYRIETKSGFLRWFYDVGHLVVDEQGKRWFYVVIVDIDDRKRLREEREIKEQLEAKLEAAQEANRAKSLFLSNASHDMRTPLNGIVGYTELALGSTDINEINRSLRNIQNSSQTLMDLIRDTLDLSKIETGTYTMHLAPISCREILNAVTTAIRPLAEAKNIDFVIDNSKSVLANINTDAAKVQEVMMNLLTNAVKFTHKGGKVELIVECIGETDTLIKDKIVIRDNGRGISPEFLPHIYEAFAQEREWDEENTNGTGLGLAIVKKMVELLHGKIEVESEVGKGTTFTLYLNLEKARNYVQHTKQNIDNWEHLKDKNILVMEDNYINSEIAIRLLEREGMKATVAKNGQQGFEIFQKSTPYYFAGILMDIRMPVMDGLTATRSIRQLDRDDARTIPIIAMSGNAYQEDVTKAKTAGMDAYLTKPVIPGLLYRTLAEWIK